MKMLQNVWIVQKLEKSSPRGLAWVDVEKFNTLVKALNKMKELDPMPTRVKQTQEWYEQT